MALLEWGPRFSVNIREIDEQHKRLFALVNDLYDAMKVGRGREVVGKVLAELVDYTVYHFNTEERLFRQYGYPEEADHAAQHAILTAQARDLKQRFDAKTMNVTVETLQFLKSWLNDHILDKDQKYVQYLNGRGVK